ncbi:hypothetical protein LbFV_ORF84 [Leptopilina boulardi filamentous virus]|uniref:Uncharacterized protein n=1 Tax=Leptopilina boulardi filamentous virus TaxID=552509 RepID=A0A1S5YDD4_9VIRU|nr:hypothetical protein LbFV_ORF84 [Leptopilina boulardi filamentous virus]AQQ80004.1 hypothetical protein LbFV_ORF84 [Leptopilina boulardi filamentous virus]
MFFFNISFLQLSKETYTLDYPHYFSYIFPESNLRTDSGKIYEKVVGVIQSVCFFRNIYEKVVGGYSRIYILVYLLLLWISFTLLIFLKKNFFF